MDRAKAELIKKEMDKIGHAFSDYQESVNLPCRSGCGKCCFKKEIFCTPIELLPLAFKLLAENRAEEVYDHCQKSLHQHCILLSIADEVKGFGTCSEYENRPFVCRTFAVTARKNKHGNPEFSICKIIKEDHGEKTTALLKMDNSKAPFIELWKSQLDSLDPAFMEEEHPINKSLSLILERLLFVMAMEQ